MKLLINIHKYTAKLTTQPDIGTISTSNCIFQGVNKAISTMLENIAQKTPSASMESGEKSQLFMEMLADLTRDLDEF